MLKLSDARRDQVLNCIKQNLGLNVGDTDRDKIFILQQGVLRLQEDGFHDLGIPARIVRKMEIELTGGDYYSSSLSIFQRTKSPVARW